MRRANPDARRCGSTDAPFFPARMAFLSVAVVLLLLAGTVALWPITAPRGSTRTIMAGIAACFEPLRRLRATDHDQSHVSASSWMLATFAEGPVLPSASLSGAEHTWPSPAPRRLPATVGGSVPAVPIRTGRIGKEEDVKGRTSHGVSSASWFTHCPDVGPIPRC